MKNLFATICSLLLLCGCGKQTPSPEKPTKPRPIQPVVSVVDHVLEHSDFRGDVAIAEDELKLALASASLIVRAAVLDSDTTVKASSEQKEVSTGQGWAALRIAPRQVLYGHWAKDDIFVSNVGVASALDLSVFSWDQSFAEGAEYFFFLKPDDQLSRWCNMKVFSRIEVVLVRKESSNKGMKTDQ